MKNRLVTIITILCGLTLNAEEKSDQPQSNAQSVNLEQIKKNSAARRNFAKRNPAPRVKPQNAGGLNADKLNKLLANAATQNRRNKNSAYLNRVNAVGISGDRNLRAFNRPETNRQLLQARGGGLPPSGMLKAPHLRPPSGKTPQNIAPRFPAGRKMAPGGHHPGGYQFAFNGVKPQPPHNPNRVTNESIQKAVEAALAKREAESFTGKVKQFMQKFVPHAAENAGKLAAASAVK